MRRSLLSVLAVAIPAFLIVACSATRSPVLERDSLFRLSYGIMEDQVELLMGGDAVNRKTSVYMRGGLVLVASGYGNRIMEFTSYGDLLTLYYNPENNPEPVLVQPTVDPELEANRRAYAHLFNAVGEIAVTGRGDLLVEDRVPDRLAVFDDDLGVMLNRVVVRLDSEGNQIDYLGQEGIGGTYFPYVQHIDVTSNNEIVVVTTAIDRVITFWFAEDGTLLRRIEIDSGSLPVPSGVTTSPVLGEVFADRDLRRLYLKIDYAVENDGSNGEQDSDQVMMARIYWLDIEDGQYDGFVDIPPVPRLVGVDDSGDETISNFYEFLGTASGEQLFLLAQRSRRESQLLILNTSGKVVRRRSLVIDYDEVVCRDLQISETGVLTGLLASRDDVEIVWWRTDRLLGGSQ
jgi:hypothetical protein